MKLISAKPARLHCATCDETYSLPQNGNIKLYKELKCPLDEFELVLWTTGAKGKVRVTLKIGEKCVVHTFAHFRKVAFNVAVQVAFPRSDDLVLREAGLRQVTCIVRERQLRLYGHVARLPT